MKPFIYLIPALAVMAAASNAFAAIIDTQIYRVEAPAVPNGVYSVLSTQDGRVYGANAQNAELIRSLQDVAAQGAPVHLIVADDEVIGFAPMTATELRNYRDPLNFDDTAELLGDTRLGEETLTEPAPAANVPAAIAEFSQYGYQPTILSTMDQAHALFKSLKPLSHSSQCHERAMVWSHSMWLERGIKSMKVFLFYTAKFRNTYVRRQWFQAEGQTTPFKWWYHTAPYVYVGDKEVVLDAEFRKTEDLMDEWLYHFVGELGYMQNNTGVPQLSREAATCRIMTRYQEYNEPGLSEWCMVRKTSMYYMQPNSVEALDCDPTRENASNKPNVFLPDGRPKYPCYSRALTGFDPGMLEKAYAGAPRR